MPYDEDGNYHRTRDECNRANEEIDEYWARRAERKREEEYWEMFEPEPPEPIDTRYDEYIAKEYGDYLERQYLDYLFETEIPNDVY